jgi:phosphoribosylamine--glycine ligase
MKVLVIGSGGREHALAWKLRQSPRVQSLYCAPGNPGIASCATNVPIKAEDLSSLLAFAVRERIDLTVVGPEQPLAEGIVDLFRQRGLRIFGPTRAAAELEWSKVFAKEFMARHQIPTASHRTFSRVESAEARAYLQRCPLPAVLKADGLAAGKGVVVCSTREEAFRALRAMTGEMVFGSAGLRVVVEEFLVGQEASVFAVSNGKEFVSLPPAQDHKRVFDGDQGKNTGGMGAYAPAPIVTPEIQRRVEETIIRPTLDGMRAEGRPYSGCLYVGLMLTPGGPRVVEYNCRFGDPETQVVLPLYEGDLADMLWAACPGGDTELPQQAASNRNAVCVVLASGGYPDEYRKGEPIHGLDDALRLEGVTAFHAGTAIKGEQLVTAGGRVLGMTAVVPGTLRDAIHRAYEGVARVRFVGMHYRKDIGRKAL